jgi:hypothetical protein
MRIGRERAASKISCFNFSTYDVAYTQFRQDHFGLPVDGAPEAPKHVGASWYFKYMVYFEKCISLVFLSSYFENEWSKLQNQKQMFSWICSASYAHWGYIRQHFPKVTHIQAYRLTHSVFSLCFKFSQNDAKMRSVVRCRKTGILSLWSHRMFSKQAATDRFSVLPI